MALGVTQHMIRMGFRGLVRVDGPNPILNLCRCRCERLGGWVDELVIWLEGVGTVYTGCEVGQGMDGPLPAGCQCYFRFAGSRC